MYRAMINRILVNKNVKCHTFVSHIAMFTMHRWKCCVINYVISLKS